MPGEASFPVAVVDCDGLAALVAALQGGGYQVIAPQIRDGGIVYEPLDKADALPRGWIDLQDGGAFRLEQTSDGAYFGHTVGSHTWKRWLYPPQQVLWSAQGGEAGFAITPAPAPTDAYALFGVRACELAAIAIQDKVFGVSGGSNGTGNGIGGVSADGGYVPSSYVDSGYAARRRAAFLVAVNCGRAAGTCFCVSMGTGPQATAGYDLALTELQDKDRHEFLLEAGSIRGGAILATLPHRAATPADIEAARAAVARAAGGMGREMVEGAGEALKRNPDHPRWDDVGGRCMGCANCTMVCPTCFCSTMEDSTDLSGTKAERTRRWDSCFTLDFSYIHGGSIRRESRARYRQWLTHKLGWWQDQFDSSGCTGCGRCITWCPVGIDLTEEARAIRDSEGRR